MLTQKDLDEIEKLIDEKLTERIKHLPTKDEFYKAMGQIMGQLKKMQEPYELAAPQITDHDDQFSKLEDIHPSGKHAFA